jgi:hypothetical protein
MRIAGADQAIGNLVKWSTRDDWAPYREEVFASHLDFIADKFDVKEEELVEMLGETFGMLYAVMLEDFFAARFGDDGELNVVDDYLKRRGWREKIPAKRYLAALRDSTISLYEIVDLDPGKAMTVRDLIRGGEPVTVEERLGSQTAARWDRIAARLVTVNGKPCFKGAMLLMPHDAASRFMSVFAETSRSLRTRLRREAKKQGENPGIVGRDVDALLLEITGSRLFTHAWLMDVIEKMLAPLPEMRNADGDKLLFSEVRFAIVGDEAEVAAVIDGIEDVERKASDGPSWKWHGRGSPSQRVAATRHRGPTPPPPNDGGRTSLGTIEIRNGTLRLSTNSRERAETGRDLLASRLGARLGNPLISHQDIEKVLESAPERPETTGDEIPPEIAARIVGAYLDDHYRRTLDDPLPILDGKTPRQAAKTKKGRAKAIEWLKYLENAESRRAVRDGRQPYDMTWMWRELKLDDER